MEELLKMKANGRRKLSSPSHTLLHFSLHPHFCHRHFYFRYFYLSTFLSFDQSWFNRFSFFLCKTYVPTCNRKVKKKDGRRKTIFSLMVTRHLRATRKSDTYARPHPHQIHCAQMSCHVKNDYLYFQGIFTNLNDLMVLLNYLKSLEGTLFDNKIYLERNFDYIF